MIDHPAAREERDFRYTIGWLAAGVTLLMLGWYGAYNLLAYLAKAWTPALRLLFNDLCLYGVGLPLFWLCVRQVKPDPAPVRPLKPSRWWMIFLIAMFLVYATATATNLTMQLAGWLTGKTWVDRIQTMSRETPLWAIFLFTVVISPMGEELIMRRCLCDRLRPYGEGPAALLSAIAFALFHINVYQFGYAFVMGLLLAYLYLKTGRLRYVVAVHMGINLVFGLLTSAVGRLVDVQALMHGNYVGVSWIGVVVSLLYSSLINAAVIAGLVLLLLNRRRIRWEAGSRALARGRLAAQIWRSPFVWFYLALTSVLTLLTLL